MAARPAKNDWKQFEDQIIEKIDVLEEFKRLVPIRTASDKPTAKGWLKVHAFDREDNNASAYIGIEGPCKGLYRDWADPSKSTQHLFHLAAKKKFNGDRIAARNDYAKQLGIAMPGSEERKSKVDSVVISGAPTAGQLDLFTTTKSGITSKAIIESGCLSGTYPKNWRLESRTRVFAAPMYGSRWLFDGPITAYHIFSIDARNKVRLYAGKGEPAKEEKTLTLGEYGLMNVGGLSRLDEVSTVWLVEGISDMLAVQSIIAGSDHAVYSCGGCNNHIKPEWVDKFAGKTCYVCFDVGDSNDAGQRGAIVNCALLAKAAKEVRNVTLPAGSDGGKNDLRAWITEGKRTYADMLSLAALMPVWVGGDSSSGSASKDEPSLPVGSPHQHLLDRLGCVVVGQVESTSHIVIHSLAGSQRMVIKAMSSFGIHEAQMMFGVDVANSVISLAKTPEPGKVSLFEVRTAIAAAANGKIATDVGAMGGGVWMHEDEIILVGKGFAHKYGQDKKLTQIARPTFGGRRLDYSNQIDWYTEEMMQELLRRAESLEWRHEVVGELLSLFGMWDNWEVKSSNEIAAGLVLATFVQTCWEFRPHVCITGPSNSGKTMLIDKCMSGIFNGLCASMQKGTEAGLRQKVKSDAVAVVIDEFEADRHRKDILELLRTSTRGGKTPRGTATGKGQDYGLKHLCWVSAIEVGLTQEADQNRFIRLVLCGLDADRDPAKRMQLPSRMSMADLGHRASACAIYTIREARGLVEKISRTAHLKGVSGRYIESLAVPASMLALNRGWSLDTACGWVEQMANERHVASRQTSDEEELIEAIQSSKTTEGGRQFAISSLVESVMNDVVGANWDFDANAHVRGADADRMLQGNGIRVLREEKACFIHPKTVTRFLLQNTRFAEMAIGDILERVGGAVRESRRIAGHPKKGVMVPITSLFSAD